MWRKLGFQIYKTENGFKTYFKWQRDQAINEYHRLKSATFSLTEDEIEKYMTLRKLLLVDSKFHKSLSLFEKVSFENYLEGKGLNEYGKKHLSSVIEKWMNIFFEDDRKKIDKKELGLTLSLIRENRGYTKSYLAELMGVAVQTVYRVENGEAMPSLVYVYLFSKVCEASIDRILETL